MLYNTKYHKIQGDIIPLKSIQSFLEYLQRNEALRRQTKLQLKSLTTHLQLKGNQLVWGKNSKKPNTRVFERPQVYEKTRHKDHNSLKVCKTATTLV